MCVLPGVCGCHRGWSGTDCNVSGVVSYGGLVKLFSSKRPEHLLFSDSRLRSPGSTAQAVLNWRELRSQGAGEESSSNWWQVLGPSGTSDDFLFGFSVEDGARIRLKHVASGAFLRGDGSRPAFTRKDLHEVSAAVDAEGLDWQLIVNGSALGRLTWGIGSAISLRHAATQHLLTCSGQTYPVAHAQIFRKKQTMVHEVQLQQQVAGGLPFPALGHVTPSQVWRTDAHRDPPKRGDAHLPFYRHSIVRLASPSERCYANYRATADGDGGVI